MEVHTYFERVARISVYPLRTAHLTPWISDKGTTMTRREIYFDGLKLHGANHGQLLNAVTTKKHDKRLWIPSVPLFRRTYGLLPCNYDTSQDVNMGLSSTFGVKI